MDDKLLGRLLILTAAVMWSTSGFFAKSPLFADWPLEANGLPVRGPLLACWRSVFAALVVLPFVRRPRWTPKLVPMVLAYAAMNYTFLAAMTLGTEANAIWLQHTAPVWVFGVGVLFFREPLHSRDGWLLTFCIAGVLLILWFEVQGQSLPGVVFGLASGLTYAGVVLSLRHLRAEDGAWLVTLNSLVTVGLFFPFVLYYDIWPGGGQTLYLAGFGIFQMGLPYLLFARGLRHISGHEASGIVLLEPILVPLWVFLAWRHAATYQSPQWWTLLGGLLILSGLLARYGGRRPRGGSRPEQACSPEPAQRSSGSGAP
jgi:drug/metabolite transporter, DME family